MEIWSLVAEYLLLQNPQCLKRGGSLLACASREHREAVEMALRVNPFPTCSRPFFTKRAVFSNGGQHDQTLRFCKTCPGNFELADMIGDLDWVMKLSPCVKNAVNQPIPLRYTMCLTTVNQEECLQCFQAPVLDDCTVIQLVHHKACRGCLRGPPDLCNGCYNILIHEFI
jgi:hypothetical protein